MAGKKRAGLGANPLDWIRDTTEEPEIKAPPKQKPRTKKEKASKVGTPEVQELNISTVQEEATEEVHSGETLELPEIHVQEGSELSNVDTVSLESDPLYREYQEAKIPKYQRLDVKLYVLLRDDQLESLAKLTREIMKNRTSEYKKERITKNTILRALIDNLKDLELDVRDIPDEVELAKRISDAIRAK